MVRFISITFLTLAALSGFAHADPEDDAKAIVEMTATKEVYASGMSAMADLMAGNIQNEVSKAGETMSDAAAALVASMMSDIMAEEMESRMSGPMAQAYIDNHSPEALAAYRAFLETPEGSEIAKNIPVMTQEGAAIGEQIGAQLGGLAVTKIIEDIQSDSLPEGTSSTLKRELESLFLN